MIYIALILLVGFATILLALLRLMKLGEALLLVVRAEVSNEYKESVQVQKTKKPSLKAVKQVVRGRSVTETDDLVDMADLPWEEGYKILEEMGK